MTTILVVDDYVVTQRVLAHQLSNQGFEVVPALSGTQALERLNDPQAAPIDLVILDIAMADIDGLTLLGQLRADWRFEALPIVMLTASGQDSDRQTAIAAAIDQQAATTADVTKRTTRLTDSVREISESMEKLAK